MMNRPLALLFACTLFIPAIAQATQVDYTLDPARSYFSCEGYVAGITTAWQTPGNHSPATGTIRLELTPTSIQFISATIDASLQPIDYSPAPGGLSGVAPADFGLVPLDPQDEFSAALRNIVFDMTGGERALSRVDDPLSMGGTPLPPASIQYQFEAQTTLFTHRSGTLDFLTPTSHGTCDFTGQAFPNGNDGYGRLTTQGSTETLELAFSITYQIPDASHWFHYTGELVATHEVPEPAAIPLLVLAASALIARRSHT